MTKIKHVWDQDQKEFIPVKYKVNPLVRLRAWVDNIGSWPEVRKFAAVALILRLFQLGKAAYWYDEGVTAVLSRLPWPQMIAATAGDVHPPAYYIIIWLLARTGIPITEFTARGPSMILSVIAIYLTWLLAEKLELSRLAKYAVVTWVIISPLQLHYAQEARMYALLQVEVLTAFLLLLNKNKVLLSVTMAAILYTHNYAVFYLPTLALAALVSNYWNLLLTYKPLNKWFYYGIKVSIELFIKDWLVWFIAPVLLWVPWFLVLLGQMDTVSAGYWIQPVTIPAAVFVLYQMLFAYSMPPVFQGLGVLLTMGALLYTGWRLYRDRPKNYQVLLVMAATPLLLSLLLSIIWRPVLLFRGLIGTAVPLIILVVIAIEGIKVPYKKVYAGSLILVTLLAGLYGHYTYNPENKGQTTTWVHSIEDQFKNGDVILSLNDNGVIAVMTYGADLPMYKLTNCGQESLGSLSKTTRKALGVEERTIDQLLPGVALDALQIYTRVWYISTVSPVSPPCELAAANAIIAMPTARLIESLHDDEYTQAGVYLITPEDYY